MDSHSNCTPSFEKESHLPRCNRSGVLIKTSTLEKEYHFTRYNKSGILIKISTLERVSFPQMPHA